MGDLEILKAVIANTDPDITFLNLSAEFPRTLTDEGARIILEKAKWLKLKKLTCMSSLTDEALKHLCSCDWKELELVNLQSNKITQEGARYLSEANWKNLTKLVLVKNKIGPKGAQHLSMGDWGSLATINLDQCDILSEGAYHLSNGNWPNLRKINLSLNNIGNRGVAYLKEANWPGLEEINLSYNKIDATGAYSLSLCQWPNLKELVLAKNFIGLYRNKLSDLGAFYLSQMPCQLNRIQIQINELSSKGVCLVLNSDLVRPHAHALIHHNGFREQDIQLIRKVIVR